MHAKPIDHRLRQLKKMRKKIKNNTKRHDGVSVRQLITQKIKELQNQVVAKLYNLGLFRHESTIKKLKIKNKALRKAFKDKIHGSQVDGGTQAPVRLSNRTGG